MNILRSQTDLFVTNVPVFTFCTLVFFQLYIVCNLLLVICDLTVEPRVTNHDARLQDNKKKEAGQKPASLVTLQSVGFQPTLICDDE